MTGLIIIILIKLYCIEKYKRLWITRKLDKKEMINCNDKIIIKMLIY